MLLPGRGIGLALLVVICLIPVPPTIEPIRPRESTRYWTMSKGYTIAYTHLPSSLGGQAPPIIFLPGGPGGYIHSSMIEVMRRCEVVRGCLKALPDPREAGRITP